MKWSAISPGWWITLGALILIGVFLSAFFISGGNYDPVAWIVSILIFFSLILTFGAWGYGVGESWDRVAKWEENVAKPYINDLPVQKKEIVYIKIDPELSHSTQGNLFYTYSKEIQRTPLTISFKGNGVETMTNWYETHMELTDEEKPYVEYQKLSQSLGDGFEKGLYNVKIYLPESYKFTDIK